MKQEAPIAPHTIRVLEYPALMETVAEYAFTEGGKKYLIGLLPSTDSKRVEEMLCETKEFLDLMDAGNEPRIPNVPDLTELFGEIAARRVPFEPEELNDVASALEACGEIRKEMKEKAPYLPKMAQWGGRIDDFSDLIRTIRDTVGPDGQVRDSASHELKKTRERLMKVENLIMDRMQYVMNAPAVKDALENRNILERNGRPVLALKAPARRAVPGVLHDKSQTGQTVYVEPQAVTGLVNEMEEIRYEERREVTRILWALTGRLSERQLSILLAVKAVYYIDATFAKARFGAAYGCRVPELSSNGTLEISNARHPLLCKYLSLKARTRPVNVLEKLTPLDFRLGEEFSIVVVTGPNTGGKTVALKTIGLIALMTQSGLPIPAREPLRMPVYKGVFADIGDEQSIEQSLSTFSSHLTNMAEILEHSNGDSLVLLDEVGSGTDPAEGAALGMATLDYLREKGAKTVITTHLGALKAYAYQAPEVENASMEFDRNTLLPTYRLLLGQPGSSNALAIARRYKMPAAVTGRMEEILGEEREDAAELIRNVQHVKSQAEKTRRRNERLRQKLTQSLRDATKEKEDYKEQSDAHLAYTMQDVMGEIEDFARSSDTIPEPWKGLFAKLRERLKKITEGTPREQHRLDFLSKLQPGDTAYVTNLGSFGEIQKVNHRQKTARLKVEGILYDIPFQNLDEKPFVVPDRRKAVAPPPPPKPKQEAPEPPKPIVVIRKRPDAKQRHFLDRLKPGDKVYLAQFQDKGAITKIDREKNRVWARLGLLEVQVPFDTLSSEDK